MELAIPSDQFLSSSAAGELEIDLKWKGKIEPHRVSEVELELLVPILPELIAELMLTDDSTDAE